MTSHFWIKNPGKRNDGYRVNFNGFLEKVDNKSTKSISLTYNEVLGIIIQETKEEMYSRCKEIFDEKSPQSDENKKELSKVRQSILENIFLTHKTL